jgi:hypothetical protein
MLHLRPFVRPAILLAIVVAVVALPTAASSAPSAGSANSQTFTDSTGENPAAPDITTIVVSNDDAGTITFRINTPNKAAYSRDVAVFMFLDSDSNQATGDPESLGADFLIQLFAGEIVMLRWDGTDYGLAANQSSLSYAWQSGPTIKVSASDLNNTRRFNFDVTTVSGIIFDETTGDASCPPAPADCARDSAPTLGFYNYSVVTTRPTLVVRSVTRTPARPTAGRPFTIRMVAARSDTGAVLRNGRVTCSGRAGTTRLPASLARVQGGAVVCTWRIPANARGRTFRGTVTVAFEGLRAARSYSATIR